MQQKKNATKEECPMVCREHSLQSRTRSMPFIKTSLFCYWQRLKQTNNPVLYKAFLCGKNHSPFFNILNNDETIRNYSEHEVSTQQQTRNARFKIKQQSGRHYFQRHYFQNWLKLRNSTSDNSRQKFTHKEIKKNYQLEEYLTTVRNPAHRIRITRLRLGVHSLRIQTGKYGNTGGSIPVEERKCLVCKENHIEYERHFLMYCKGYDNISSIPSSHKPILILSI